MERCPAERLRREQGLHALPSCPPVGAQLPPPDRSARGMTLVEIVIALVLIMLAFWAFYEVAVRTSDANDYVLAFTGMCASAQKAVNDIREDLSVAKLLFRNDTVGQGYLAALSFPAGLPRLPLSRLPGAREGGIFECDTALTDYTGNILLFTRTERPYQNSLRYRTDVTKLWPVRVDLYRIVIYYLSKVAGARIGGRSDSLNLVRAYTGLYADYIQVRDIVDPKPSENPSLQNELLKDLYVNQEVRYLWDTTAAVGSAFYRVTQSGTTYTISATPQANYNPTLSAPTEFIRNLRFKHATVSWNTDNSFRCPVAVPLMGLANPAGDGFPNGFEVQVIGLSGARQTLVSLTISRQTPTQRIAAHRAHVIVTSKDYY